MGIIYSSKQLKPRAKKDFYPTPYEIADTAVQTILPVFFNPVYVLDPGAGDGVFGKAVKSTFKDAEITGIEERLVEKPIEYDTWITANYLETPKEQYDLIIGNPPYSLSEEFIRKSLDNLYDDGILLFLLPLSFLESKKRFLGLFHEHPPHEVHVAVKRPSFTNDRRTDNTAYAYFMWYKEFKGETILRWFYWDYAEKITRKSNRKNKVLL